MYEQEGEGGKGGVIGKNGRLLSSNLRAECMNEFTTRLTSSS
jgi:hypothetical protein